MRLSSYPSRNLHLDEQTLPAWIAILGLVLISSLCVLAGAGGILRLGFPLLSLAVGLFLYLRYPVLYIGFTLWIWFLTPWLRRVVDSRSGWDPQGVMLLAPFLVTLVTFITLVQHLPRACRQGGLPFILALSGVFYAFFIGLILNPPLAAARALLDWLTPILFGFHLFVHWRDYPRFSQNIQRAFTWCVLITGIYGVVQYLVAPEWDRFWIIKTELVTNGTPEPLGIRVFSTMNSPGPFANVMIAGLLLLLNSRDPLRIPASVVGYLVFLLSLVRSAWGGFLVGLFTLLASLKARFQMRLIVIILVMAVCIIPLTAIEPFSEIISTRVESLYNIKDDVSFNERSETYEQKLNIALSNGLGSGMGGIYSINDKGVLGVIVLDSGILDMFFTLGWFGAIPYVGGVTLLLLSLFQGNENRFDSFASAARAISVSVFAQLMFGSVMLGLPGLMLWGFLGISMAARRYYQYQHSVVLEKR
ncbi:O-antigen ligase family protein [Chroococcidiopsis sp. CCMEE 29]|uniref:O-antigen ligase family protein n=1 Tax=Chroococcidiopsis sp. CCMEE 29 TaxID=155894 RepID=UPI00202238D7|nr:O-antigen ligase family protein [Chroococcidiopsis sp. CCMEE 29]